MTNDVVVLSADKKLVIVNEQRYLLDIIFTGKETALCRGENIDTGEITDWIEVDEPINAAFRFGDHMKEKI